MDDEIIAAVSDELNISFEDAKEFLSCERGCSTGIRDWNGEDIWMSGELIMRLLTALEQ